MTLGDVIEYIRADRSINEPHSSGRRFLFWYRLTKYLKNKRGGGYLLYLISREVLTYYSTKFGFDFSLYAPIGKGLAVSHISGIILFPCSMGDFCWVKPGVLIGESLPGSPKPVIGHHVNLAQDVRC